MRTHAEPHTVAREVETAVAIGTDRPGPDVAIRRRWPTDDVAVEPGNLSGVQLPIDDQLPRASHDRRPYVRAPTPGVPEAASSSPTGQAAAAAEELPLWCAIRGTAEQCRAPLQLTLDRDPHARNGAGVRAQLLQRVVDMREGRRIPVADAAGVPLPVHHDVRLILCAAHLSSPASGRGRVWLGGVWVGDPCGLATYLTAAA